MSLIRIVLSTPLTADQVAAELNLKGVAVDGARDRESLGKFIQRNKGEGLSAIVVMDGVRASLNGTFTGDPTAGQALTINGVAFTARASGAVADEFNITTGANAAPLAAAINASTSAKIIGQVRAEVVSAQVIKLEAIVPGTGGNLFTASENLDNFTLAGGATALSGGTEDAPVNIENGQAV